MVTCLVSFIVQSYFEGYIPVVTFLLLYVCSMFFSKQVRFFNRHTAKMWVFVVYVCPGLFDSFQSIMDNIIKQAMKTTIIDSVKQRELN